MSEERCRYQQEFAKIRGGKEKDGSCLSQNQS